MRTKVGYTTLQTQEFLFHKEKNIHLEKSGRKQCYDQSRTCGLPMSGTRLYVLRYNLILKNIYSFGCFGSLLWGLVSVTVARDLVVAWHVGS